MLLSNHVLIALRVVVNMKNCCVVQTECVLNGPNHGQGLENKPSYSTRLSWLIICEVLGLASTKVFEPVRAHG